MNWQPIETAPKDTDVLGYFGNGEIHVVYIRSKNEHCYGIYMQEHEMCRLCEDEEREVCTCEEPDLGESFRTEHCGDCAKFLRAIKAAEKEEGCEPWASQPSLENMLEEVGNLELESRERYFAKAREMFPEISSYLDWLQARFRRE